MSNKPKYFLVFKILGFLGIGAAVAGLVLIITGFGDFESNNFMIGSILMPLALVLAISLLVAGFRPEIAKMSIESKKYIQQQNQQSLTDIADTNAEIYDDAITHTAGAIKKGLTEDKMYCKHCGAMIDSDSKFCSKCGKEQ
jgi:hypothetical protein